MSQPTRAGEVWAEFGRQLEALLPPGAKLPEQTPYADIPRGRVPVPLSQLALGVTDDGRHVTAAPVGACEWCDGKGSVYVAQSPLRSVSHCPACRPRFLAAFRLTTARLPADAALWGGVTDWSGVTVVNGNVEDATALRAGLVGMFTGSPRPVLLLGPPGTGKTRMLAHTARAVALYGRSVVWHDCRALLAAARGATTGEDRAALLGRWRSPTVAIIDEAGAATEFERGELVGLIHDRHAAGRATWLASNAHLVDADAKLGGPVVSRSYGGIVAELGGADWRRRGQG